MINIDLNKAKEIGHEIRRAKREEEFAPLDIKATIPMYAAEAEAQRQSVRDKYAEIQIAIDSSKTIDQIKEAIEQISSLRKKII